MHILAFFLFAINVVYATPIMHANFAYRFLDEYFTDYTPEQSKEFILGVLYPDVRYLQVIDRDVTHEFNVSLEDVLGAETPFKAGVKLHCFIDEVRDRYIEETLAYQSLERFSQEHVHLFLKLIEDEILYNDPLVNKTKGCLDNIIDEEFVHGLTLHTMKTWHRVLSQYLSNPPGTILRRLRQFGLGMFGVNPEEIALWSRSIGQLVAEDFKEYIQGLTNLFDQEIAKK
jgi:hypothetical protein